MRFIPLASGSQGNATLVEFDEFRLLVDAGLSARELGKRLSSVGVEPDTIDALVLSHEHSDHARGAEVFSNKHDVRVVCSWATLAELDLAPQHFAAFSALDEGAAVELGPVTVEAFPVPHDAVRPVGFVIHGEGLRIGVATDLGHATRVVVERLRGCDLLMIESNHDSEMLRLGPYPWQLKQRVAGRMGHLSNAEAAAVLRQTAAPGCQAVVLAHLSAHNNTPELARSAATSALSGNGCGNVAVHVAAAGQASPPVQLAPRRLF
ncbi:MAG: MBL fold metallo-hydrolase [bacterium]|nr:MBL fold metallo-hydrolase [bacterium]